MDRVRGIKDSSNSEEIAVIIPELIENGVAFYQGWENKIVDLNSPVGNICSLSNLYPKLCYEAANNPSLNTAHLIENLCQYHNIFEENWYAHIKNHLNKFNIISSNVIYK